MASVHVSWRWLQPTHDAAWQALAVSGNESLEWCSGDFLLLMLLLPVADQTALPIRRPKREQSIRIQGHHSSFTRRLDAFPSVGNGEPIGRVAQLDLLPRVPSRLSDGNQFINRLCCPSAR